MVIWTTTGWNEFSFPSQPTFPLSHEVLFCLCEALCKMGIMPLFCVCALFRLSKTAPHDVFEHGFGGSGH